MLRVVARIKLALHVVAFAAFLRRFVEDPPTIVDFLVLKQGTSLSSIPVRKYGLIFLSANNGHRMRGESNKILV